MSVSWRLGRVAGIDVFLHPTFLLLLLLPGVVEYLPLVLATFGCVFLHELGHALVARRFGIGTADITLYPIGGVARLTRMPRAPGVELAIALAGPAVNLAIAAALLPLVHARGGFLAELLLVNLVLALFNLVPAFPMDGGRVLRAILGGWIGRARATSFAAAVGRTLAVAFGVYSLLSWQPFQAALALFIFLAAGIEEASVLADERRRGGLRGIDWSTPAGFRWVQTHPGVWRLDHDPPPPRGPSSSSWSGAR